MKCKSARQKNKCFATDNLCFILFERERERGGEGGREILRNLKSRGATCKTRPRNKRGGMPDCPPATSHSVQDVAKKIQRFHALAPQRGTPARESQRRTPALPRGRSVAATAEGAFSLRGPPHQSVSNPKQFCLPGSLASPFALSEYTTPSAPPGLSNSVSPNRKRF